MKTLFCCTHISSRTIFPNTTFNKDFILQIHTDKMGFTSYDTSITQWTPSKGLTITVPLYAFPCADFFFAVLLHYFLPVLLLGKLHFLTLLKLLRYFFYLLVFSCSSKISHQEIFTVHLLQSPHFFKHNN